MTTALKRLFSLPPRTIRRRTRALGVLLTAALPIGLLCACASAGSSAQQAMELRAGVDSDLLDASAERRYAVTEGQLIAPSVGHKTLALLERKVESTGYIVVLDGVIIEGRFEIEAPGVSSAAFELTEPIALRPNSADETSVTATGTLTTPAGISPDTRIRFTPTVLADDAFEIDVRIAMPETHPLLSSTIPLDDIVAHIVFAAE